MLCRLGGELICYNEGVGYRKLEVGNWVLEFFDKFVVFV